MTDFGELCVLTHFHAKNTACGPCWCASMFLSVRTVSDPDRARGRSVGVILIQDFEPEIHFEGKTERVRSGEDDGQRGRRGRSTRRCSSMLTVRLLAHSDGDAAFGL